MGASKWAYDPERCDGQPCPGDCDRCTRWQHDEWLEEEPKQPQKFIPAKGGGAYRCYYCGEDTVGFEEDCTYDEVSLDGDGIVMMFHCSKCGALIEYRIPMGRRDDDD